MGDWLSVAAFLAVLTPLAGVPLTAILFYVRGLREQYAGRAAQLLSRVDRLEGLTDTLIQRITDVERNCATREEWIRESMLARRERQRLIEGVIGLQARLQEANGGGLVARLDRATQAALAAAERMERACDTLAGAAADPAELSKERP
jgi:hypothetical protein